ncbi:hypothetical protein D9M68_837460 [compost metagenome]
MGAKAKGRLRDVLAAPRGHHLETHPARVLHRHVAQAPDPQHRDQVSGFGAALPERIEGRDARAQDRRGVLRIQFLGDGHQARAPRNHHFRIAAIARGADDRLIGAQVEVPLAARPAQAAMAAHPADTDALPDAP